MALPNGETMIQKEDRSKLWTYMILEPVHTI